MSFVNHNACIHFYTKVIVSNLQNANEMHIDRLQNVFESVFKYNAKVIRSIK